jgi:hypothetical protein
MHNHNMEETDALLGRIFDAAKCANDNTEW